MGESMVTNGGINGLRLTKPSHLRGEALGFGENRGCWGRVVIEVYEGSLLHWRRLFGSWGLGWGRSQGSHGRELGEKKRREVMESHESHEKSWKRFRRRKREVMEVMKVHEKSWKRIGRRKREEREVMEVMEVMKSHESTWKVMKVHEKSWKYMKSHESTWKVMKVMEEN